MITKQGQEKADLIMLADKDDIKQEIALYRIEHPNSKRTNRQIALDVMRSTKYNYSWGATFRHIWINDPRVDIANLGQEHFMCFPNINVFDKEILGSLLYGLNEGDKQILALYSIGMTQSEISTIVGVGRSSISKRLKRLFLVCREKARRYGDVA